MFPWMIAQGAEAQHRFMAGICGQHFHHAPLSVWAAWLKGLPALDQVPATASSQFLQPLGSSQFVQLQQNLMLSVAKCFFQNLIAKRQGANNLVPNKLCRRGQLNGQGQLLMLHGNRRSAAVGFPPASAERFPERGLFSRVADVDF